MPTLTKGKLSLERRITMDELGHFLYCLPYLNKEEKKEEKECLEKQKALLEERKASLSLEEHYLFLSEGILLSGMGASSLALTMYFLLYPFPIGIPLVFALLAISLFFPGVSLFLFSLRKIFEGKKKISSLEKEIISIEEGIAFLDELEKGFKTSDRLEKVEEELFSRLNQMDSKSEKDHQMRKIVSLAIGLFALLALGISGFAFLLIRLEPLYLQTIHTILCLVISIFSLAALVLSTLGFVVTLVKERKS